MTADEFLDITDVVCPITFVKTKVALEDLDDGQILELRLNDGEPIQNLPRSLKDDGHKILELANNDDGTFTIFVEKGGLT
ncbi:MAG: sulfurtransferase TusA family protein [Selenomonadaceae bacterium]|nr:sulfurtransferase TusA family protein [Selenomonadaceae bacterium]